MGPLMPPSLAPDTNPQPTICALGKMKMDCKLVPHLDLKKKVFLREKLGTCPRKTFAQNQSKR